MNSKLTSNLVNTLLLTFVLLISTSAYADSETVDIDQGTYLVFKTDKATRFDLHKGYTYAAHLMKWNGTDPIAVIPDEVRYKGKMYAVLEIKNAFRDNDYVEEIHFGEHVWKVTDKSFVSCPKLKNIYLSSQMKEIPEVYNCPEFQEIVLPKGFPRLVSCKTLTNIKAPSVEVHGFHNRTLDAENCNIDTLYINYAQSTLNLVQGGTGKVGTIVVRDFRAKAAESPLTLYCNFDNVVIERKVGELPQNFIVNKNLKSLTVSSSSNRIVNDGCFVGLPDDVQVQTTDDRIKAQVYYAQGLRKIADNPNSNTELLQKSSDLGCAPATFELAMLSKNETETIALLKKAKSQGYKTIDIDDLLQFYDNCKRLRELYPTVAAYAKSLTCDTTLMRNVLTMCEENGINKLIMNRQEAETALKYKVYGYDDIRNKGLDMYVYYLVCKELTQKRRAYYYVDEGGPSGLFRWLGRERDAEIYALESAAKYSDNYSKQSAPEFRSFFAASIEKLTTLRKEIWEKSEKDHQVMTEKNNQYNKTVASRSSIDPNTVSIPSYENGYGSDGQWQSIGGSERKEVRFSTGEKFTIYRSPQKGRGWVYWPNVYGIKMTEPGWKTEEDAAAAGYVCQKYDKIRTVGRYPF